MALDFFATYVTDEKKEIEGAKCELGNEAYLVVARADNRNYLEEVDRLLEANKDILSAKGPETDKKSEELMIEVMARTILLGWENFTWQGKKFPYNYANAVKALQVKDFRRKVSEFASNINNFRADAEEAATKNS